MPYVPSFSITPARITEPAVGASVCASGSQVCSGKSGTLMAKARKNAPNISSSVRAGRITRPDCKSAIISGRSNVCVALKSHRIATSIRIEPNIVYRMNLMAA